MKLSDIRALDLTTPEGMEQADHIIFEHARNDAIEHLRGLVEDFEDATGDSSSELLKQIEEAQDYIRLANRFIEKADRPKPILEDAPTIEEINEYETEFLIDGRMPANRVTLFTGDGGIGKSYMALQNVVGLALGVSGMELRPVEGDLANPEYLESARRLDRSIPSDPFTKDPIKVVIASYEEDLIETWKRISRICQRLVWPSFAFEDLREQIKFVDLKMFGPIWGVQQDDHLATRTKLLEIGKWLFEQCEAFGARLLMLDPSAGAFGGNENARESVREFCSHLNGWGQREETQCATLLIAHPPKSDSDYSGSTDWLGSCRAMWALKVETEEIGKGQNKKTSKWYELTNIKQSYAPDSQKVYLRKIKSESDKFYSPVWERCTKLQAQAFYINYKNDNSLSILAEADSQQEETPQQEDKNNDGNSKLEALKRERQSKPKSEC